MPVAPETDLLCPAPSTRLAKPVSTSPSPAVDEAAKTAVSDTVVTEARPTEAQPAGVTTAGGTTGLGAAFAERAIAKRDQRLEAHRAQLESEGADAIVASAEPEGPISVADAIGPKALGGAYAAKMMAKREERMAYDRRQKQKRDGEAKAESDVPQPEKPQPTKAEPAKAEPAKAEPAAVTEEDEAELSTLAKFAQYAVLLALVLVVYVGLTAWQIWGTAQPSVTDDGPVSADAVVVLGAAQYDGTPSPVLEGRLAKALEIYNSGEAAFIIPTGSNQEGDRFTEGFTGFTWLRDRGVPEEAILVNVDGGNTWEQLTSTAAILEARELTDAILVSDPYHTYRLTEIADEAGLEATVVPTDLESTYSDLARETAAVSVGRLIGFRRLSNLRG